MIDSIYAGHGGADIRKSRVAAGTPEKPFFLYYAPGACHAPHHAPKDWIERFKGRFDMGYEAIRETILARQAGPADHHR